MKKVYQVADFGYLHAADTENNKKDNSENKIVLDGRLIRMAVFSLITFVLIFASVLVR